jgi:hypothetical protein
LVIAELIGLALIAYGIWFAGRGVLIWVNGKKDWWRPIDRSNRYPYPAAGVLLGVFFVILGLRFALNGVWAHAAILGYVGGALFLIVLAIGVGQPHFLHPPWYRELEDRLGKKGMQKLRAAAFEMDKEEWSEIAESESAFEAWVKRAAPAQVQRQSRGYRSDTEA